MFEIAGFSGNVNFTVEDERRHGIEHDLLWRVEASRFVWLFFINCDGVQTGMREVDPVLRSLAEVYNWLLPPGYLFRQGDVAIYRASFKGATSRELSTDVVNKELDSVLYGRHVLECNKSLRYCNVDRGAIVQCTATLMLVHPEHPNLEMEPGTYRLVGAAGVSYPIKQNAREFRGAPIFC
ncbi:MAG: hypothetical protein WCC12_07905 [Anaerolineales bacterium]